jgi:hypothetical protein
MEYGGEDKRNILTFEDYSLFFGCIVLFKELKRFLVLEFFLRISKFHPASTLPKRVLTILYGSKDPYNIQTELALY